MKTFEQMKRSAAVQFIFTAIVLCVAAFFYIKTYYAFRGADGTFVEKFSATLPWGYLFFSILGVWFLMYLMCWFHYGRVTKIYGAYFGGVFGRILLILELAGVAMFVFFLLK